MVSGNDRPGIVIVNRNAGKMPAGLSVGLVVQGLWLQYYGLKVLSVGKNAQLENEAVLAGNLPREDDLPEPAGFMVAT